MFEYCEISAELQKRQACYFFKNYIKCLYRDSGTPVLSNWHPEPTWVTDRYRDHAARIKDFKVRQDDVWILSYPKTGTTLTCEMASVLLSGLDFEKLTQIDILRRIHFLEYEYFYFVYKFVGLAVCLPTPDDHLRLSALSEYTPEDYITRAETDPNGRIIKSHLQMNLMPRELFAIKEQPKIIYVARNPKDAAISQYHHHRNIHGYDRPLNDFLEDFLLGELPFGSYFRHVEEFSRLAKVRGNFLFITYEDMVQDMSAGVSKVAQFLGISLSNEDVSRVADFLNFDKMKTRATSNMQEITELSKKDAGRIGSQFQ